MFVKDNIAVIPSQDQIKIRVFEGQVVIEQTSAADVNDVVMVAAENVDALVAAILKAKSEIVRMEGRIVSDIPAEEKQQRGFE